ncbi:o-succinylbenzoate--CoA ligase [Mycolicibacterium rhodesiae JS60]|nr:o-succinylbenzoate--CoA ligase [Mycolicibacterium rhodesiae JS60]
MPDLTLSDICSEHRRRFPERLAVIDGGTRLTWPEFDDRVNRAARLLADRGVGRGDRVLWLAQSSSRFLELMMACARLGAMICPANWRQSADELAFVINDFDPAVIIWQALEVGDQMSAAHALAGGDAHWIQHDSDEADGYERLLAGYSAEPVPTSAQPHDALLVIYTAAIIDRPAGSMLSQHNLLSMAMLTGRATEADHESVFVNSGPLFHIGNFQFDSLPVFLMGGTNIYVRRVDEEELLTLIAGEKVTSAFLMPPTIFTMLELNKTAGKDISSLKAGPFSPFWGEALPPDTRPWAKHTGGFGQTEVTGLALLNAWGGGGIGNAGRPSPLCQVRILAADGSEVPDGTAGEIAIRGDTVHLGYWNRPEVNAERFRDGWWLTRDRGRREADGTIEFMGTLTRMIKSAAENIYPPEVERCLLSHPAVRDAAIIGVPDPQFAQSVKAILVLEPGQELRAEDVIEYCRSRIASYKKPKFVEFVDEIPKVNGRADYDALDGRFGGGGYPGGANVAR